MLPNNQTALYNSISNKEERIKMTPQEEMADFYKIPKSILKTWSLWPHCDSNYCNTIKRYIVYLFSAIILLSSLIELLLRYNSFDKFVDSSPIAFGVLAYSVKFLVFCWNFDVFKLLLSSELGLEKDDGVSKGRYLKISSLIPKITITLYRITVFLIILGPLVEGMNRLPVNGWFPWNLTSIYELLPAYLMQSVGLFLISSINGSLDTIIIALILVSCWQVRLLKNNLSRITYDLSPVEINKQMIRCSKHYLGVIRYVQMIEEVFGLGLFFQFFFSGCGMCITGVEIIVNPIGSGRFFTTFTYFVAQISQISAFCLSGQQLITESDGITNICYEMNWWSGVVPCSREAKTTLYLMMERSKRPIKIGPGHFFVLSLSAFSKILRTSYSYFTILQNLHANNKIK